MLAPALDASLLLVEEALDGGLADDVLEVVVDEQPLEMPLRQALRVREVVTFATSRLWNLMKAMCN